MFRLLVVCSEINLSHIHCT